MKRLGQGGVLFTFSCSGGIGGVVFQQIVAGGGVYAVVDGVLLVRLAGSFDHPTTINFPEVDYLKGLVILKQT